MTDAICSMYGKNSPRKVQHNMALGRFWLTKIHSNGMAEKWKSVAKDTSFCALWGVRHRPPSHILLIFSQNDSH